MTKLAGKVALVTGSSKGIGAGIAVELARAGASVCINYTRSVQDAEHVVKAIERLGGHAIAVRGNVADQAEVATMIRACEADLGDVDILVTNAVTSKRDTLLDTKPEELQETINTGIIGTFHAMQQIAKRMVEKNIKGAIIHISSPHAYKAFTKALDYNVAKAGSHHLALSAASELMWYGIRVNILEPGLTDTAGERVRFTADELVDIGRKMPLGRVGVPADLGRAAVFLASDDADYITGAVLKVDGGQFAEGGPAWIH